MDHSPPSRLSPVVHLFPVAHLSLCVPATAAAAGAEFEARILASEANNVKFNFLQPTDPYHAYYRMRVSAGRVLLVLLLEGGGGDRLLWLNALAARNHIHNEAATHTNTTSCQIAFKQTAVSAVTCYLSQVKHFQEPEDEQAAAGGAAAAAKEGTTAAAAAAATASAAASAAAAAAAAPAPVTTRPLEKPEDEKYTVSSSRRDDEQQGLGVDLGCSF